MSDNPPNRPLYTIVSEDDVYRKMVSIALSPNPIGGLINISNLASLLHTSRYQVRKHMRALRSNGMVELHCTTLPTYGDDDPGPPYWGYRLTDAGRETPYFKAREKADRDSLRRIFAEEANP